MLQTLPKTIEVLANGLVITPVAADKADDDSPYSAKMCPQPVDLIMDAILEMLPTNPKRERCRVKKRLLVPRRVLPVMARSREHRATPRRDGGARADRSASGDDGGGGGSDPPPPRLIAVARCDRDRKPLAGGAS